MKNGSKDISPVLKNWNYEPGKVKVRRIRGLDGKLKLQVRLDLGILQMELDGRPDGKRPHGNENLLKYFQQVLKIHKKRYHDTREFYISADDCQLLYLEIIQYYHRYLSLRELGDLRRIVRDTQHNLDALEFMQKYGDSKEFVNQILPLFPTIIRFHYEARAILALKKGNLGQTIDLLDEAIQIIRLFSAETEPEEEEDHPDLQALEEMKQELLTIMYEEDDNEIGQLYEAMNQAIKEENYEQAAIFRDEIRRLLNDLLK